MGGQFGVENLTKILVAVADTASFIDSIAHGGSKLAVFQLAPDAMSLAGLDVEKLKQEVSELDADDRRKVVETLQAKLVLTNPKLQQKIAAGVDIVNEVVYLAQGIVDIIGRAKALFAA